MAWEVTTPAFGQPLEVIQGTDPRLILDAARYDDQAEAERAADAARALPFMGSVGYIERARAAVTVREVS
jgi:hypothetical protein